MSKEKKKFKDTAVGSFITKNFPKVKDMIGDVMPNSGVLGIIKNIISKDPDVDSKTRDQALKMLQEFEMAEMEAVTRRWEADMTSDNWLSKSVRPLTMMFLTLFLTVLIFIDSSNIAFEVDESYISLLKGLLMLIYFAYFGGRTAEKWKKMNNKP